MNGGLSALAKIAASFQKQALELHGINAVFGDLAVLQKNHRHIQVIAFTQFGIAVDIDLAQASAKFGEQRVLLLSKVFDKPSVDAKGALEAWAVEPAAK